MTLIALPSAPRLDVRDLRVVLAVAAAGTTAKAAPLLHLTQPAVSRALLAAEERLGVRLFDRTPRGLVLTAAGESLRAGATRLLAELAELERGVCAPTARRRIRLVCECYTAYHWLPAALLAWRQIVPELDVVLAVEHTRDPIAALAAGRIDVALLTSPSVPRPLVSRRLFSDEIVFVMAASHPLAANKAIAADDLRSAPLLVATGSVAEQRWFLSRVFGRARPTLRFERLPLTEAILEVTRAGMGIAVLSEWIATPHLARGDLVARRLDAGPLLRPWRLAWRSDVGDVVPRLWSAFETTAPRSRRLA